MGFQGTIVDIGHAAGPLLSGVLIGLIDYQWAFAIIAVLQLMAAILFLGNFRLVQPAAGSTNGGPVL
jgi:predicted MFS family arabinose efflux permease